MVRRLCGDTAACVNMRRPFFILRSTRSFRTARPASSCGSARRARRFRLFPGRHSPFSPSLVVLAPFPSSRRLRAALAWMLPVLPSPFPHCVSNDVTANTVRLMIKPRRLRRVRTQQLHCNAEHPRGPTLNNLSPLCSSGALRASSDKNALVGPHPAKMFFRASIALSGAFLRLKRQELSKVTQLFPRRKRLLLRGLRPRHGCAPRSDRFLSDQRYSSALPPLFPFLLRSRFVPAATDAPHAPFSASRLSRPRHSCPLLFRARFLLPLSCRRASFPEFSPDVTTRRALPGVILLPARPAHAAFSLGTS